MKLELINLSKTYGKVKALDHVNLTFENGVYALLGPNGAGKTTMISMLATLLRPTKGEILCDGRNIYEIGQDYRKLLGYMPQNISYYKEFTAEMFLQYMCEMKGLKRGNVKRRTDELLHMVNLENERKRKVGGFSGGMKQRLGIAQALINDPGILILDEPTAGLDPKERVRFRNIIHALGEERIIIYCTHIVSDVEHIAGRVLLLQKGCVIRNKEIGELLQEMEGLVWEIPLKEHISEAEIQNMEISNVTRHDGMLFIRTISEKCPNEDALPAEPRLEDVYMYFFHEV